MFKNNLAPIVIPPKNQAGESVANLCREYGMSQATFYKWRSKYGDADVNIVKRLKELEAENSRLKKMYADERLMSQIRLEV
jgi:putative transposase